jgi:hypothetical protein
MHALQKKKEATVVGNEVKQEDVNGSLDIRLLHHLTLLQHQPFNWENEELFKYGDTKSARNIMLLELKKSIEANFRDKLAFQC